MLQKQAKQHCEDVFVDKFGYYPAGFAVCPASANILGGHNGQDGLNVSMALNRHCVIAYGPRSGAVVRVVQTAPFRPVEAHQIESFELNKELRTQNPDLKALHHIASLMQRFGFDLRGADIVVENDIGFVDHEDDPLGRFSALKLAFMKFQAKVGKLRINAHSAAQMVLRSNMIGSHFVANNAHPITITKGHEGHVLRVDRLLQQVNDVVFPQELTALIIDTGKRRHDVSAELMRREQHCQQAAKILRVESLRSVSSEQLQLKRSQLGAKVYQHAKFVVQENERIQRVIEQGPAPSAAALLRVVSDSQLALQDQYEVSCEEIDYLAYLIKAVCKQQAAVRLLGTGFGGYVLALVTHDNAKKILTSCIEPYRSKFGLHPQFFLSRPVDGLFEADT